MTMVLTPAYGRDYRSKKAVLADLNAGLDFKLQPQNCYINNQDLANDSQKTVNIRYQKITKVLVANFKDGTWK